MNWTRPPIIHADHVSGQTPSVSVLLRLVLVAVLPCLLGAAAWASDRCVPRWHVPWYRDTIYASQGITTAELMVAVDVSSQNVTDCGLYVDVDGDNAGVFWAKLRRQRSRPVEAENLIELDARRMGYGKHSLRLALFTREEQILLAESRVSVRKLPPGPAEVCPNRRGMLLVNGKPTFILAAATGRCQAETFSDLAAVGCNVVLGTGGQGPEAVQELLDAARTHGFLAVPPVAVASLESGGEHPIRSHGMDTALLGWNSGNSAPVSEAGYAAFVECSAYRPLVSFSGAGSSAPSVADVLAIAPVVPKDGVVTADVLTNWGDAIAERASCGHPTWAVIPAVFLAGKSDSMSTRSLPWLAVAAGAQGIVLGDGGNTPLSRLTEGTGKAFAEVIEGLGRLRLILAEGDDRPILPTGVLPLRARAFYHRFRWLVVAVNLTETPGEMSLSFPDMSSGVPLRVVGEERVLTTGADGGPTGHGIITDTFEPYQVHVYTTIPHVSK